MENTNIQGRFVCDPSQFPYHVFFHVAVTDVHCLDHETGSQDLGAVSVEFHVQRERIRFKQPKLRLEENINNSYNEHCALS